MPRVTSDVLSGEDKIWVQEMNQVGMPPKLNWQEILQDLNLSCEAQAQGRASVCSELCVGGKHFVSTGGSKPLLKSQFDRQGI